MFHTLRPLAPHALRALPFAAALAFSTTLAPAAGAQTAPDSPLAAPAVAAPATDTTPTVTPADVATSIYVAQPAPAAATRAGTASAVAAVSAFRIARTREAGVAVADASSQKKGKVYMILGGAALVTGAVVGDDAGSIIMVSGAVVGLWGLYQYLK